MRAVHEKHFGCVAFDSLDQLRTFSKLGYVSTFVVSNMNSYPSLSLLFHSCWESVRHKGITSNPTLHLAYVRPKWVAIQINQI